MPISNHTSSSSRIKLIKKYSFGTVRYFFRRAKRSGVQHFDSTAFGPRKISKRRPTKNLLISAKNENGIGIEDGAFLVSSSIEILSIFWNLISIFETKTICTREGMLSKFRFLPSQQLRGRHYWKHTSLETYSNRRGTKRVQDIDIRNSPSTSSALPMHFRCTPDARPLQFGCASCGLHLDGMCTSDTLPMHFRCTGHLDGASEASEWRRFSRAPMPREFSGRATLRVTVLVNSRNIPTKSSRLMKREKGIFRISEGSPCLFENL